MAKRRQGDCSFRSRDGKLNGCGVTAQNSAHGVRQAAAVVRCSQASFYRRYEVSKDGQRILVRRALPQSR
jgi:hypothetical protein